MALVTIGDAVYTAAEGDNLGRFLAAHGLGEQPCGGHGRCGNCRVTAVGALRAPDEAERRLLTPAELAAGVRLACRTVIEGDCRVRPGEGRGRQIRTDGTLSLETLAPRFAAYGAAVDIGTTTIAARLYDTDGRKRAEAGTANPQTAWGADVISRMEAAVAGDSKRIAAAVVGAVDGLLRELAAEASIAVGAIDGVVLTGNTAMLHLLTETEVSPLLHAPFAVPRSFGETITAAVLGLTAILPETAVYLPPCVSAFIGADTVCAVLATRLQDGDMLVDIGTNGEIVLVCGDRLLCCSTAAGPALEGAGIAMGMPGRAGAIDHMILQGRTLVPHVIGDGTPQGLCGSGLVDAVACLLDSFRLDPSGRLRTDPAVIAPPVVLTQADIRAVQLAKAAIAAGIATLRQTADSPLKTVFVAGGFGSYLDKANAVRIGLLPGDVPLQTVGNAALSGAALLLLDRGSEVEAAALVRRMTVTELSTDPVFADMYMNKMNF